MSVLMYAISALKLSTRQVNELNACWNSVIRRLFGYRITNKFNGCPSVQLCQG